MREHALFPLPPDADPADFADREIAWLYVQRDGAFYPEAFSPSAIPDESALAARWGGGTYKVTARNAAKSRITASVTVTLAGISRPFLPAAAPTAAAPTAPTGPERSEPSWLGPLLGTLVTTVVPLLTKIYEASKEEAKADRELRRAEMMEDKRAMFQLVSYEKAKSAQLEERLAAAAAASGGGDKGLADLDLPKVAEHISNGISSFADMQELKTEQIKAHNERLRLELEHAKLGRSPSTADMDPTPS